MTFGRCLRALLLLCALGAEAGAQRVSIGTGRQREPEQQRRERSRYLYERPIISPWAGIDLGLGAPIANCAECGLWYGGMGLAASGALGITLYSRLTLAVEASEMNVLFTSQESSASLTLFTARFGTKRGLLVKAGYGTSRFNLEPSRLVDDRRAWVVGGENCMLSRVDGCLYVDYSQSGAGANGYRMHAVRTGLALRFHALRGRRVTLPPRGQPTGTG